jgi:hypothetical protein
MVDTLSLEDVNKFLAGAYITTVINRVECHNSQVTSTFVTIYNVHYRQSITIAEVIIF